jgi:hypothetical protein
VEDLASMQRRFYDYVTAGKGSVASSLIASGDPDVYARMYSSRLHDAIAEDYPKLRKLLGDDDFATLIYRYVTFRPPQSYTLRDAGVELASFLRRADTDSDRPWMADLATLERARVEAFDGKDSVALAQDDVAAVGDALPDMVLRWVPASFVVSIAWNVDDMWSAIEEQTEAPAPTAANRVILVWRRDLAIFHRTLDDDEATIAPMLVAGATFTNVCEVLAAEHGEQAAPRAVELLLRWLQAESLVAIG